MAVSIIPSASSFVPETAGSSGLWQLINDFLPLIEKFVWLFVLSLLVLGRVFAFPGAMNVIRVSSEGTQPQHPINTQPHV